MKPQQLSTPGVAADSLVQGPAEGPHAILPALTAIAVAIASSVALMFAGFASNVGIVSIAQPTAPVSIDIDAGTSAPVVTTGW